MTNKIPANEIITFSEYSKLRSNKSVNVVNNIIHANRGTIDSRCGIHVYKNTPEAASDLYSHDSFDIIYCVNEDTDISVCGKIYTLHPNSVVFIAPGVPYNITASPTAMVPAIIIDKGLIATQFHGISKYDGVLPGFFANAMWGDITPGHIIFSRITNPNVMTLFGLLINEELSPTAHADILKTNLLLTISGYLSLQAPSTYEISPLKIARSEQIIKILSYIQDNYRNITLEKLAENFHYTVPYVSKLVRSATGMTFTDILRETKFEVCLSLLLNSDLKINKIAEIAGFQNTDHFNRIFKKRMGQTPTDYKKTKAE